MPAQAKTFAHMAFEPLTPTAFLKRSASVFGDRIAVIDGALTYTHAQFYRPALQLAGALHAMGLTTGARVAVPAPKTNTQPAGSGSGPRRASAPAARPRRMGIAAVIGLELARPRTPSVPKRERVIGGF
mgnify:CR=1 FL=1